MTNTDKPTYKLLKDLPNAKVGVVYTQTDNGKDYVCYDISLSNSWDISYPKEYIENNPDWFQLQQPKQESQKITIERFGIDEALNIGIDDGRYSFRLSEKISAERLEELREAIEFVLSKDEAPEEGKENEWIVLSVKNNRTGTVYFLQDWDTAYGFNGNSYGYVLNAQVGSGKMSINSVLRKIDNLVFTVDDVCVGMPPYDSYPQKPIKRFFFIDGTLMVQFLEGRNSNDGCLSINGIRQYYETNTIPNTSISCGNTEQKIEKPILGLMPLWLWKEQRLKAVTEAIERCKEAGKEIPQIWIDEKYLLTIK